VTHIKREIKGVKQKDILTDTKIERETESETERETERERNKVKQKERKKVFLCCTAAFSIFWTRPASSQFIE
jgi:hypothetical protein